MQKIKFNNYLTPLTMKFNSITHRKGFTLVELIIVIAIIAVLASLAFMSMSSETGNARDSSRKQDVSTFENAIATSNSKNRPIVFGTATTLATTAGTLNTLRGAFIKEIDDSVFEPTILQKVSEDPSKNKYIGVFLNDNMYQLFATLENPDTGVSTTLIGGTFKEGVIIDTVVDNGTSNTDVASGDTTVKVQKASKFLINDTVTIGSEDMLVTGITGNVLTVTRAQNSTTAAKHLRGSSVKLKTFAEGALTNGVATLPDSSGKSLLCLGTLVDFVGTGAPAAAPADAYCDEDTFASGVATKGSVLGGSQVTPYSL
jgi:prepilin-type N-terminal cleavage/methylation domain-containing protein